MAKALLILASRFSGSVSPLCMLGYYQNGFLNRDLSFLCLSVCSGPSVLLLNFFHGNLFLPRSYSLDRLLDYLSKLIDDFPFTRGSFFTTHHLLYSSRTQQEQTGNWRVYFHNMYYLPLHPPLGYRFTKGCLFVFLGHKNIHKYNTNDHYMDYWLSFWKHPLYKKYLHPYK